MKSPDTTMITNAVMRAMEICSAIEDAKRGLTNTPAMKKAKDAFKVDICVSPALQAALLRENVFALIDLAFEQTIFGMAKFAVPNHAEFMIYKWTDDVNS